MAELQQALDETLEVTSSFDHTLLCSACAGHGMLGSMHGCSVQPCCSAYATQ